MSAFLSRENAPDLAYVITPATEKGAHLPTVLFLGGFRSDMAGTKATYFEAQCKARGQAYVRMDYRGHGQSQGKFEEGCIGEWAEDANDVMAACTKGNVILVGSSMGGWVSLLLARKNPERIAGIVGVAAAPDFTTWMEAAMSDNQRTELKEKGFFELPNAYDDSPYIISKKLIDDGRKNTLLDKELNITMPLRLVQGMVDADVEWQTAHRIKNVITGDDVEVILIEGADHRLSTPEQLEIIDRKIIEISNK